MQPRRETEQTPWENQPPASGHGFGAAEDDAYETVKPVGYEARLAFERFSHLRDSLIAPS